LLADAIERIISDPKYAAMLGSQANTWARCHFSRIETVRRLMQLFNAARSTSSGTPLVHDWHEMPKTHDPEAVITLRTRRNQFRGHRQSQAAQELQAALVN